MGKRTGEKGQMLVTTETRDLGMGFVWPIMENRYGRGREAQKNQDTKPTLWPLCLYRRLDPGKIRRFEN